MAPIRPRRSVLYMPGANDRALEKSRSLAADAVILDLEDSVAPDAKIEARQKVCAIVKEGGYGRREVIIRPNALETAWGTADILAAASAAPDAIIVSVSRNTQAAATPPSVVGLRTNPARKMTTRALPGTYFPRWPIT